MRTAWGTIHHDHDRQDRPHTHAASWGEHDGRAHDWPCPNTSYDDGEMPGLNRHRFCPLCSFDFWAPPSDPSGHYRLTEVIDPERNRVRDYVFCPAAPDTRIYWKDDMPGVAPELIEAMERHRDRVLAWRAEHEDVITATKLLLDAWQQVSDLHVRFTKRWHVRDDIKVEALAHERNIKLSTRDHALEQILGQHDPVKPLYAMTPGPDAPVWYSLGPRNVRTMRELAAVLNAACDFVERSNPRWSRTSVWNGPENFEEVQVPLATFDDEEPENTGDPSR